WPRGPVLHVLGAGAAVVGALAARLVLVLVARRILDRTAAAAVLVLRDHLAHDSPFVMSPRVGRGRRRDTSVSVPGTVRVPNGHVLTRRERSERLAQPAEVPASPAPPPRARCAARRPGAARDSEPLRSGGSRGRTGGSPPRSRRPGLVRIASAPRLDRLAGRAPG